MYCMFLEFAKDSQGKFTKIGMMAALTAKWPIQFFSTWNSEFSFTSFEIFVVSADLGTRCAQGSTWMATDKGRGRTFRCSSSWWGASTTPCWRGPSLARSRWNYWARIATLTWSNRSVQIRIRPVFAAHLRTWILRPVVRCSSSQWKQTKDNQQLATGNQLPETDNRLWNLS